MWQHMFCVLVMRAVWMREPAHASTRRETKCKVKQWNLWFYHCYFVS